MFFASKSIFLYNRRVEKLPKESPTPFSQRQRILQKILQSPQTLLPLHDGNKSIIITNGQLMAGIFLRNYNKGLNTIENYCDMAVTTFAGIETVKPPTSDETSIYKECVALGIIWKSIKGNAELSSEIITRLQPNMISKTYGIDITEASIASNNFVLLVKHIN